MFLFFFFCVRMFLGDIMNELNALLFSLGAGLFILVGYIIVLFAKNSERFIEFAISMAFGVIVALAGLEILPEALELSVDNFGKLGYFYFIIAILGGFFFLKLLDHFIPDHERESESEIDKNENFYHIGLVSSIALVLHNLLEGMSIYTTALSSTSMAFSMMLGVGLHNIPLGLVIASTLKKNEHSKKQTFFFLSIIVISTLFGGIVMYLLRNFVIDGISGILLSMTLGMLLYIAFFELLEEILHSKALKKMSLGILLGISIFICSLMLG